jgi:uncharacterized DUF497 family protein
MEIEFDTDKDDVNKNKHGVSLAFAANVMADPHRVEILDLRFDYGEERWAVFGTVEGRVWICVYTLRGNACRVISVRKANDRETKQYIRAQP